MKLYRLCRSQTLPASPQEAWQFFSSPRNLPSLTPPWLNLAVHGEVSDRMFPGMLIRYRLMPLLGIPVTWISEITHVDPPHYFVDEQRFGPYQFWHHQHDFRPLNGDLEMIDTVHYALKHGPIGVFMHALFVRKKLKEIFDFRENSLEQRFPLS